MSEWAPAEAEDTWQPDEAEHVGKAPAFDVGAIVVDPKRALQHATPFGASTVSGALDAMPDEESRARSINQMYVLPRTSYLPRRVAQENWPAVRDGFARSIGYEGSTISEGAFTALLQEHAATDKKKVWADAKGPMDRLKLMFGDHGVSDPDLKVEGAVPMIGSEAAGTKGGAFTVPKMQGNGTFAGLINATNKTISSLTTPANAAIMVGTGGAGAAGEIVGTARALTIARATQAAALGTFTAVGVKDTASAWAEARMVMNDPEATDAQKADAIATVALSATMTAFAAKGTYDFGAGASAAAEGAPKVFNPKIQEAVDALRKEAKRQEGETAQALEDAATHLEEGNKPAEKKVIEELDKVPLKEGESVKMEDGKPVVTEAKPKQATVEELDNGGFVVTDEAGKLIDYATDAERAAAIKEGYEGVKKPAPAEFQGVQEGLPAFGDKPAVPDFELYNLTEDIPGHPKGSTVSRNTLEKAGYEVKSPLEKPKTNEPVIGIKNESVDRQLKELGLEEGEHGAKVTNEANFDMARTVSENDPQAASRLVERLNKSEQSSVSATEVAMLAREAVRTSNERKLAHERVIEAVKSGDEVELQIAKTEEAQAQDRYEATLRASDQAGTSQAQAFQIRQRMLKEDYSLAAMERRAKVVNEVTELPAEKQAEIVQLSEKIAATEKAVTEYKEGKKPQKQKGVVLKFINEQASSARARIKARLAEGRSASGLDPLDLADHAIVGAEYLAKGAADFAQWSTEMVKEFGERITPHLKDIFDKATEKLDNSRSESAYARKKARLESRIAKLQEKVDTGDTSAEPVKSGRPEVAEIEKLTQQRDGLQEQLNAMRATESKIADLELAIADKTKKIEGKDLSTKGQPVNRPSVAEIETLKQQRDALNEKLAEARKEASKPTEAERIQKQVEALQERIAEKKDAIAKGDVAPKGQNANRPAVEAIETAKQELADLNRQIEDLRNPEKTPEQKRLSQIEAQITRIEEQIDSGELFTPGKKPSATSPEIKAAEAKLEALTFERDNLRETLQPHDPIVKEPKTAQEKRLADFKGQRARATEELNRRIKEGDFEPKAKAEELHLDDEANRLQAEHDMAKLEYDRLLERDRYQKLPPLAKALRHAADSWDVLRSIKATGELSPILRQGGFTAATHPLMTAKAVPDMLRALVRNEVGAHALNNSVLLHPDLPSARKAGLHIMDEHSSLNAKEEMFAGRLVGKVPGLKRLDRATTVYLNRLRFDLFQELRQGARSAAEEKAIANFVNVSTGRGKLGVLEPSAVILGRALFSPRFWASRVQMVAGQPMWGGTWNTRRIIAKEYVKGLVSAAGFYAAMSLYKNYFADNPNDVEIGDDPSKSDFGKVRIHNTHVDPLAGLSQHAVYMTRTAEAAAYAAQHVVDPNAQQPRLIPWTDITKNYIQGRIHPTAGLVANMLDQHNLVGERVGVPQTGEDAFKAVAPMTYGDIYDVLRDQDVPEATAISLLALMGMSVSVYDKNAKKGAKLPSK